MDTQLIAALIDHSLSIVGGIVATLIGFRLLGPKPGRNDKYDVLYGKWIRHLKWMGPLFIVVSGAQLAVSAFAGSASADGTEQEKKILQAVQVNISSEGKLAEYDHAIEVPEGFKLMVPKGYTYSKPPGTPLSLVAIFDVNGAATPFVSVSVLKLDDSLGRVIENMKATLIARNQSTRFSETQLADAGRHTLNRTSMSSQRDGGYVKGEMLFFENAGKAFILIYGTRDELLNANIPVFEKIIRSFGPA